MHDQVRSEGEDVAGAERAESHEVVAGSAASGVVLLCDHASNALPQDYGSLGLSAAELARHIAYDIGAESVTRKLAAALHAPAVMTRFSRLLIDCNRGTDDPTLIMQISDGAVVPGNRSLGEAERLKRIQLYYEPYHRAIGSAVGHCLAAGRSPILISVHSYTDRWKGSPRPWHAGILWDRDDRVARPLIEKLRALPGLIVGDNEPYSGRLKGDTMWRHGTMRGLAHAIVEIRQDLIADERGQGEWAARLAHIVAGMLACPETRPQLESVRHYGSAADG